VNSTAQCSLSKGKPHDRLTDFISNTIIKLSSQTILVIFEPLLFEKLFKNLMGALFDVCCSNNEHEQNEDRSQAFLIRMRSRTESASQFRVQDEHAHRHRLLSRMGIYHD
jgi:hypothetical protein